MNLFVAVEGIDGSGKTSLIDLLVYMHPNIFVKTAEPAPNCACYDDIRRVLRNELTVTDRVLTHMFAANRYDHIHKEINPFIHRNDGKILLCDRYVLSSLVYQGGDAYGFDMVKEVNADVVLPSLTLFLNTSPEIAQRRVWARLSHIIESNDMSQYVMAQRYSDAIDYVRGLERYKTRIGMLISNINANGTLHQTCVEALGYIIRTVDICASSHPQEWEGVAQELRLAQASLAKSIKNNEVKQ